MKKILKKIFRTKNQNESGLSLLEVIVSVTFAIIVISALTTLAVTTARNSDNSRNRSEAISLAKEGIEAVRSIRDNRANAVIANTEFVICNAIAPCVPECAVWTWNAITSCPWGNANSYILGEEDAVTGSIKWSLSVTGVSNPVDNVYSLSGTQFYRKVDISDYLGADSKEVLVTVSWQQREEIYSVTESTVLTDWK